MEIEIINERFSNGYGVIWQFNRTTFPLQYEVLVCSPKEDYPEYKEFKSRTEARKYFNECVDKYIK